MAKRKKVRNKSGRNRRYAQHSLASVNTGHVQELTDLDARKGNLLYVDKAAEFRARSQFLAGVRDAQNQASIVKLREVWKGLRHQGEEEYHTRVYRRVPGAYQLTLHFYAREFIWVWEDFRIGKRKFSITYHSLIEAESWAKLEWDGLTKVTWKDIEDI